MKARRIATSLLAGLALVVPASSGGHAQTAGTIPSNLTARFTNLTELITAASYIAGLGFAVGAIMKFKSHKDNPEQVPVGTPIGSVLHALSCTVFQGKGTLLGEDTCVWTELTGQFTSQSSTGTNAVNWYLGGQREIAPGWFLGGSVGAGGSSSQITNGPTSSGRTIDAAIVLKHVDGPWLLAGAIGISTTSSQNIWPVAIPGGTANMNSSLSSLSGGLRLRGAYDVAFQGWYLRPRADVDLAFTSWSGLQESGPAPAITLDPSNKAAVGITPMLETGGRYDVRPTTILRPYVAAGASFLPDTALAVSGNYAGIPFYGTYYGPTVIAQVEAGLQLYEIKGWEMRLDYRLSAADSFLSQSLGVRAAWHF